MVSVAGEAVAAGAASVEGAAPGGEAELEAGGGGVTKQEHRPCKCQFYALISALHCAAACIVKCQALQDLMSCLVKVIRYNTLKASTVSMTVGQAGLAAK